MRIISIANQKGGCGKTTTAINLSSCLALGGRKVLLIDMDPQGHAGMGLNIHCCNETPKTILEVLANPAGNNLPLDSVIMGVSENLCIAPSDIALSIFEQNQAMTEGRETRLKQAIEGLRTALDYIVIDCPPSLGLLTLNALMAAKEVLIPVEMGLYSLHGTGRLLEILDMVKNKCGYEIRVAVVATMCDRRTRIAREVLQNIKEHFQESLYETVINLNVKLNEAASYGKSVADYDRRSRGFADYMALAEEVMAEEPNVCATHHEEALPSSPEKISAHFVCRAPGAEFVKIVGTFNDWKPSEALCMDRQEDGTWSKIVALTPGRHQYKFIVDNQWVEDEKNPHMVEDQYGGMNSILEV